MFFKDSLKVFLVLVLAFQPSMQVFAQDRAYNEEASRILATSVNNKSDAITFVRDFNADPNAMDENGDTILMKALHGELADGTNLSATSALGNIIGTVLGVGIVYYAIFFVLFKDYAPHQYHQMLEKERRIVHLFAEWEASGASQIDLDFWRTLLDATDVTIGPSIFEYQDAQDISKFNALYGDLFTRVRDKPAQMRELVRYARAINEIDKERVPDELLAIIEEYAN